MEELRDGRISSYSMDKRSLRQDGTIVWLNRTVSCVRKGDGTIDHFVSAVEDISARKRAEEQNMLGLVQAIARETAAHEPNEFAGRFTERIQALAAEQDLLIRNEWQGAHVEDLVRAQLAHFGNLLGSRITVDGPMLRFKAASAQVIGLALHELATNAAKYGALSTDKGRVAINWGTDGHTFTMSWTERDGPLVSAPKRRGFGTTVIEAMAERSLDGKVDFDYVPLGVTWHLSCPVTNALEPGGGSSSFDGRTKSN